MAHKCPECGATCECEPEEHPPLPSTMYYVYSRCVHHTTPECEGRCRAQESTKDSEVMPAIPEERKQAIIDAVLASLNEGSTLESACGAASVHPSTYRRWRNEDDDLDDLAEAAIQSTIQSVESALFKKALGKDTGHVTAAIFYLCNRAPDRWQHVNRVINELTGNIGVTLKGLMEQFMGGNGEDTINSVRRERGVAPVPEEATRHDSADGPSL